MPAPISAPTQTPNPSQKAAMLDAEAGEPRKIVEGKKHL